MPRRIAPRTTGGRRAFPAAIFSPPAHRRPRRARTRTTVGAAIAIAATVAAGLQFGNAASTPNGHCSVSAKGVPSCGVLWGTVAGGSMAATTKLEYRLHRKFAIVYHFHGIDQTLPTRGELAEVKGGRYLRVNLEARRYTSGHGTIRYADIAAGKLDATLRRQAVGFKALRQPVYVSFDHEADSKYKFGRRGTPAQFVAAWRHIHNVYAAAGATNVAWVWTVTGWKGNWSREDQLWPGSRYVDWVSFDPYNLAGCQDGRINRDQWISFDQAVRDPYRHFTTSSRYGAKPLMLSEFGTVTDYGQPQKTGQWYAAVPPALQRYPKIKAVAQFNRKNDCDFRIDSNGTVMSSYRSAGLQGYVNP